MKMKSNPYSVQLAGMFARSRTVRCILVILAFAFGSVALTNAQVNRSKKPAAGPVPKAAFPPYSEVKLKNGLRVFVIEDHDQPIVFFRTMILTGSATEGTGLGTASAVAALLQKGTTTRSAEAIAEKLDFYGASVGAAADADELNVFTSTLKKDIGQVLPIYADVIRNPSFPESELAKHISLRVNELKTEKKSSVDPGRRMGRALVYGNHPYGAWPTEETVKNLSVADLKRWHASQFVANNAIMAVVGDVTKAELVPMLEREFGTWKAGTPAKPAFTPLQPTKGMTISLIDRPASVQSNVRLQRLGLKRSDPNFDKAEFLTAIFAGGGSIGFQNRLTQNLREAHGYTYSPGGSLTSSLDPGVMVAVAEVRNAVTDSALDQMLMEYRRLSSEPVPAEELALAKSIVTGGYLMSLSDPGNTAARLLEMVQYNLPKDYFAKYASRINGLTAKELQDVAKKVFSPNDIHVIVTGDASEIKSKLERFGTVKVYDVDMKPVVAGATPAGVEKADKTLDQVIDQLYQAINANGLRAITDRVVEGDITLNVGQEFKGKISTIEANPNLKHVQITLPIGTLESWVNGQSAWIQQGPQSMQLSGSDLEDALHDAVFNKELLLRDAATKTKLIGIKKMGGVDAYMLEVAFPGQKAQTWYINRSTGLLMQIDEPTAEGVGVTKFADYRAVDGVMYPHKMEQSGAQEMTVVVSSIKHNTKPDPSVFTKK